MIILDDLRVNGLKIYRDTEKFAYGTDSVLLSSFASEKKSKRVCDLCSGTGIVPLLMSAKGEAEFTLAEIDDDIAELCRKSVMYNGLQNRFTVMTADVKELKTLVPYGGYDLVTANPPYFRQNSGLTANGEKGYARTETLCDISDICAAAKHLLNMGGRLCVVYTAERLAEVFVGMQNCGIEPKRIMTVASKPECEPYLVLVEGKKGAKPGLKIKNIVIADEAGNYTPALKQIYKGMI